jgi:hypothetical protein
MGKGKDDAIRADPKESLAAGNKGDFQSWNFVADSGL